jgi:hypothetical protein
LHKKGHPKSADNYRGISLLSVVSKIYTPILNSRLKDWSKLNCVITDAQAGFRKGGSTVDHIFTLHAAIETQILRDSKLLVAFKDFQKAYDKIDRLILFSVLFKSGIKGKCLESFGVFIELFSLVLL